MQKLPFASCNRHRAIMIAALGVVIVTASAAPAQILGPQSANPALASPATLAPAIDAAKTLAPLGLTPQGKVYAKKKHSEVTAITKEGRPVRVEFDWAGRVKSVTDANHRKGGTAGAVVPGPDRLASLVQAAGFEPLGLAETKRHHAVMRARNRQGETLELHIDASGVIYKQVWLR
ncbi:hypothetical protein [Pseudorhodoplanes sp.]|uniref:hypothetical protein n=1 Tax=Pseudorhodoplanes sp. TaxID=1934341 RepID=UPI003918E6C3